jgi:hypothetical protein
MDDSAVQFSSLIIPCFKIFPALSFGYEIFSFFISGQGPKILRAKLGENNGI